RVYFTSRRRARADTLWSLQFSDAAATKLWSVDVGDPTGGPTLRSGVLYVANTDREIHAIDAATGVSRWSAPFVSEEPIHGFVWADLGSSTLFFATENHVNAIRDDGTSASLAWTVSLPHPSQPVAIGGRVYTGGDDSHLYSIDAGSPGSPPASVV